MQSREITSRNIPISTGLSALCMADFAFRTETSRLYMARRLRKQPLRGYVLRFSPHVSAIYKQDTSDQTSESAIHRRDANRRQASSSYPGVQCAFLHTHVRLIASSTDANKTHQCSHRQRHTPRQQRDLTQTANISSLVDTRAHSRPHLHWTRGNVE